MEVQHRTFIAKLFGKKLFIFFFGYLRPKNDQSDQVDSTDSLQFFIGFDKATYQPINLPFFPSGPRTIREIFKCLHLHTVRLPDKHSINHYLSFYGIFHETDFSYPVFFFSSRAEANRKLYFVPWSARRRKQWMDHLRRTSNSRIVYVVRRTEPIENTLRFRLLESSIVSLFFKFLGNITKRFSRKQTIIFYEKFAAKSEEGTFEIFQAILNHFPKSYFVIDRNSPDFPAVAKHPNVIAKYSVEYYFRIYACTGFVGTEVPTHISILRSGNKHLRESIYRTPYIFLQHGIIYLKNLGITSVYNKGSEGEPNYIIASSQREKDVICRDLKLSPHQVLVTGLGQFSLIQNNYIGANSDDIITIMLTWRPADEAVQNFTRTSYYLYLSQAVSSIKEIHPEAKIRIVPHPKVAQELASVGAIRNLLWPGKISEALQDTKLFITDYSSACYNAFYRGSAVIFFQPDLDEYELRVGPLIPAADEYIGFRTHNVQGLKSILQLGIEDGGKISLHTLRTDTHIAEYRLINEFSDGRNLERIIKAVIQILNNDPVFKSNHRLIR